MKVVGLITEYNPFHNGHLHHLLASKEKTGATHSIAIMSGHFLQRGEPAIIDKWTRAKNAVEAGIDLVIELPTLFSCSSAEYFAFGAVSLLNDLNIVDCLCFGSEDGAIDDLQLIANLLFKQDETLKENIQHNLSLGHSYPKSRSMAIEKILQGHFSFKPNNILGIEYLKSLHQLKSNIKPYTIERIHADYMSTELKGTIASATGIRKQLKDTSLPESIQPFVPESTYESIVESKDRLIFPEGLSDLLLYKIRTTSESDLKEIHDVTEGLESRIKKVAERVNTYEALIDGIISKRYTRTRIQRILVKILLGIKKDYLKSKGLSKPLYARILAFNDKGQHLIKTIKKTSDFPLLTNINKSVLTDDVKNMLTFDITATNVYSLLYSETNDKFGGKDYLTNPIRITQKT